MLSRTQEKLIRSLRDKKGRRQSGLFLAEGDTLCREILSSEIIVHSVFATEEWLSEYSSLINREAEVIAVSESELKKISGLSTANRVLLIAVR